MFALPEMMGTPCKVSPHNCPVLQCNRTHLQAGQRDGEGDPHVGADPQQALGRRQGGDLDGTACWGGQLVTSKYP